MKNAHTFLLSIALSFTALLPMSASAQTTAEAAKPSAMAVSYTHLTLPTICSV